MATGEEESGAFGGGWLRELAPRLTARLPRYHARVSQYPGPIHGTRYTCVGCGYDLSGTALGGACPECGTSIEQSLRRSDATVGGGGSSTTCFILGLLSLVLCALLGPFAIATYYKARDEVDQGLAAPSTLGLATAGLVLGWISVALLIVQCLFVAVIFAAGA